MAYHILIEGDGNLVRGTHSIADNTNTADRKYSAHTKGCNTGSIGVAMCGMVGCRENPFHPGSYPILKSQWETMGKVVAELCRRYAIPVTAQTVLGHGEVQANLGIAQAGKWDPMILPWEPSLSKAQVGSLLREMVQDILEPPPSVSVVIRGRRFTDALLLNEAALVAVRPVSEALGWTVTAAGGGAVTVLIDEGQIDRAITLPMTTQDGRGYVSCRELGAALGKSVEWDAVSRTVTVG